MANILVTGGSGFVGSSIVNYLKTKKNYRIFYPNSKILNLLSLQSIEKYLKKNNIDIIVHTANHHYHPRDNDSKNPDFQLRNNLSMFFNLVTFSNEYKRLISFGSGAEIPRTLWSSKIRESDIGKNIPSDQYGLSKLAINNFILSSKNQKFVNLRLFGVFGELDNWEYRFIPNMCALAVKNKNLVINQDAIFDFIYIKDVIKITENIFFKKLNYFDFNVCSGKTFKLTEIAEIVKKISKKDIKIIINNNGITTRYGGCNKRLINQKLISKMTPLKNGIESVYKYFTKIEKKISLKKIYIK